MIALTASEIAALCGGSTTADVAVTGVSIDSRAVAAGDLFVALPGTRTDGARFAADALRAGAAAVLVSISDGVVLVLRYGQASRNVVARASEILLRSGAHLLGVVLNAVDLQSSDYAEYYGRAYNDYYQSRVDVEE
jgi:UDP-N-acetylmuramyl pentapeptide synthase